MIVRDVVNQIHALERNLEMIDAAQRAGFDLNVSVEQIDATRREIERLYALEIGGVNVQLGAMRACDELRGRVEDIVKSAYERLFGEQQDG